MRLSHDLLLQASPGELEAELANGLIIGHAYSITSVKMVRIHLMPVSQTPSVSLSFVAPTISCDFVYMYSNIHVLFHRLVAPSQQISTLNPWRVVGKWAVLSHPLHTSLLLSHSPQYFPIPISILSRYLHSMFLF